MESLKDKVVIVTGSTAGIGEATALMFAKYGSKVVITGRNTEKANDVSRRCEEISPNKYKMLVLLGDSADESHRAEVIEKTLQHFGKIDVLINNAGFSITSNVLSDDFIAAYDRVMDVNLRSPLLLTRLALPFLMASKGCVINVSSVAANRPVGDDHVPYHLSKGALNVMTRELAREFGPKGVRVLSVNPGYIKTTLHEKVNATEDLYDLLAKDYPLGRAGNADEVASVICFLASGGASFVTGTPVYIDGGHMTL